MKSRMRTVRKYSKLLPNFHVKTISFKEFDQLVFTKLGVITEIQNNPLWQRKIGDFKPAIGYLFSEYLDGDEVYSHPIFWGYVDIDLVFGNFSRFSYLFHDYSIVCPGRNDMCAMSSEVCRMRPYDTSPLTSHLSLLCHIL